MDDLVARTWQKIEREAACMVTEEPMLASFFHSTILNHKNLRSALSFQLANKLDSATMPAIALREVIELARRITFRVTVDSEAAAAARRQMAERWPEALGRFQQELERVAGVFHRVAEHAQARQPGLELRRFYKAERSHRHHAR